MLSACHQWSKKSICSHWSSILFFFLPSLSSSFSLVEIYDIFHWIRCIWTENPHSSVSINWLLDLVASTKSSKLKVIFFGNTVKKRFLSKWNRIQWNKIDTIYILFKHQSFAIKPMHVNVIELIGNFSVDWIASICIEHQIRLTISMFHFQCKFSICIITSIDPNWTKNP